MPDLTSIHGIGEQTAQALEDELFITDSDELLVAYLTDSSDAKLISQNTSSRVDFFEAIRESNITNSRITDVTDLPVEPDGKELVMAMGFVRRKGTVGLNTTQDVANQSSIDGFNLNSAEIQWGSWIDPGNNANRHADILQGSNRTCGLAVEQADFLEESIGIGQADQPADVQINENGHHLFEYQFVLNDFGPEQNTETLIGGEYVDLANELFGIDIVDDLSYVRVSVEEDGMPVYVDDPNSDLRFYVAPRLR